MENQDNQSEKNQTQNKMAQINRALGLFICFFAAVVLVSMFFTETFVGKMTNLVAGLILAAVGVAMIVLSKMQPNESRSREIGISHPDDRAGQ
jgi:putative Mn2+ efflux pump MntP